MALENKSLMPTNYNYKYFNPESFALFLDALNPTILHIYDVSDGDYDERPPYGQ